MVLTVVFLMKFLFLLLSPLICVAFFTLMERKVLSIIGFRLGPNKVSFLGILQPMGDALKLANKSINSLMGFSVFFYYLSSMFMIVMMIMLFSCSNSLPNYLMFKYSFLLILLMLAFNSLNSILSGWGSFSKFSLIGSIRTVAQLISYEAVLYLCLFFFFILYSSFDYDVVNFFNLKFMFFFLLPCFYLWVPSILAELNRTPYDFSEGESELVSGFNTEFSSGCFTLIFLAEYGNIVFFSILSSFLFFIPVFFFFFFFFFVWIRSVLPRFRFDKLMSLSWKFFIPFLTFIYVLLLLYL